MPTDASIHAIFRLRWKLIPSVCHRLFILLNMWSAPLTKQLYLCALNKYRWLACLSCNIVVSVCGYHAWICRFNIHIGKNYHILREKKLSCNCTTRAFYVRTEDSKKRIHSLVVIWQMNFDVVNKHYKISLFFSVIRESFYKLCIIFYWYS